MKLFTSFCCKPVRGLVVYLLYQRVGSLVPRPNTMFIGLGTTLVHKGNEPRARLARSLPVVVGKVCEHHIGKALNSAANL